MVFQVEGSKPTSSTLGNPWDLGSFMWGFAVGGIVVILGGGVILFFAWPYLIAMMKEVPLFLAAFEEAERLGII